MARILPLCALLHFCKEQLLQRIETHVVMWVPPVSAHRRLLSISHSRQYQICTMHTWYLCLYYTRMKNYKRAGTGCPRQVAQGAFKWTAQLCMKELCKISCSPRRWSRDLTTVADPVQSPMSKIMSISRTFSPQQSNLGMFPLSFFFVLRFRQSNSSMIHVLTKH